MPGLVWADEKLHQLLSGADVLYLDYDANAYRHKTSGLLWLAAWHRLAVVVPKGSWLEREAMRLGTSYSTIEGNRVGSTSPAAGGMQAGYFETTFAPFWPWLMAQ